MEKINYLLFVLFACNFSYGQTTTLAKGDIAVTGVNTNAPDEFSFVLLTDVTTGTKIHFTDCGWYATGGFRSYNTTNGRIGEGVVTWTATTDLSCGIQITIEDTGSNTYSATNGTAAETVLGFNLAQDGDQVIAFQGTTATPTFLFAIHVANSIGWTDTVAGAAGTLSSAVPAGLTEGINAMTFDLDNSIYNCAVNNNQPLILEAIVDDTNWSGHNSTTQTLGTCVFTCTAAGSCASTVTWNGSWSGTPDLTTNVIIAANYNTSNPSIGSFSSCSLTVNAGITLTVDNSTYIEVENDVAIDGDLVIETQGNFVQNDNTGVFTLNTGGGARVNKQTGAKPDWFHYTYWSSPVIGETIGNAFPNVDDDRRFWFNAANFVDNNGDDIDDNADDWQYALSGDVMAAGVGYASTEARLFLGGIGTASFEGAFNTGDIPISITLNATNTGVNWNLIGNPYPSAIDFIAFQFANSSVVDGAAYFWSQATPHSESNGGNQQSNFSKNDYATYTVGSGAAAGASGIIPNQYIPSAQGFFIAGLINGTATFTNAMRMANGTSNSQFFRNSSSKKKTAATLENRLWVNLTSDNGVFNQVLLAYVEGATNGNDGGFYDAPKIVSQDYTAILYSSMDSNNKKYVIQGKSIDNIDEDEIIDLGFSTTIERNTEYKLSIAQIEGDFLTSNNVYLKDNLLNTLHDISISDYTFTSEVGEFNNRFEIVFNVNALFTEEFDTNSNALRIVELEDDTVQFTTSKTIKKVRIYDYVRKTIISV